MNVVHTIIPGSQLPEGYFDDENITYIQNRIAEILAYEYNQQIIVSRPDIIRVLERVLVERRENVPKMNRRAIMYITNDFRTHQIEVNRNLRWQDDFIYSQRNLNPVSNVARFDPQILKLNDKKKYDGKERIGGTQRFYFT